jgi:putative intracellular protease/amidase
MKGQKLSILFFAAIFTAIQLVGCSDKPTESLNRPQVLVFVRDGSYDTEYMLTHEVGVMLSMLDEAGISAVVATQSDDSYRGSEPPLKSDILLQDVNVADYDGFLLPCMAAGKRDNIADEAVAMVAEAAAQNKPIAAQHGSIFTLAEAGLLEGKHYAYVRNTFPEGIYGGTGVVQDGNIITSGICSQDAHSTELPDGTPELTQKLIEAVAP